MDVEIEGLAGLGMGPIVDDGQAMEGLSGAPADFSIDALVKFCRRKFGGARYRAHCLAVRDCLALNRLTVQLWKAKYDLAAGGLSAADVDVRTRLIASAERGIVALRAAGVVA